MWTQKNWGKYGASETTDARILYATTGLGRNETHHHGRGSNQLDQNATTQSSQSGPLDGSDYGFIILFMAILVILFGCMAFSRSCGLGPDGATGMKKRTLTKREATKGMEKTKMMVRPCDIVSGSDEGVDLECGREMEVICSAPEEEHRYLLIPISQQPTNCAATGAKTTRFSRWKRRQKGGTKTRIAARNTDDQSSGAVRTRRVTTLCSICLSSYSPGDMIVWSANSDCHHVFHEACIFHWLITRPFDEPSCPECRRNFLSNASNSDQSVVEATHPPFVGGIPANPWTGDSFIDYWFDGYNGQLALSPDETGNVQERTTAPQLHSRDDHNGSIDISQRSETTAAAKPATLGRRTGSSCENAASKQRRGSSVSVGSVPGAMVEEDEGVCIVAVDNMAGGGSRRVGKKFESIECMTPNVIGSIRKQLSLDTTINRRRSSLSRVMPTSPYLDEEESPKETALKAKSTDLEGSAFLMASGRSRRKVTSRNFDSRRDTM